jgi:hypothetical protein
MSLSSLIIILQINLLTNKARQKRIYLLHFIDISVIEYNISSTEKKVCHSIDDFFSFVGIFIGEFDV